MRYISPSSCVSLFFFNDTATTEIYTLSLHDALPISQRSGHIRDAEELRLPIDPWIVVHPHLDEASTTVLELAHELDRKSTRLNSSHQIISYAVFCLKKKYI